MKRGLLFLAMTAAACPPCLELEGTGCDDGGACPDGFRCGVDNLCHRGDAGGGPGGGGGGATAGGGVAGGGGIAGGGGGGMDGGTAGGAGGGAVATFEPCRRPDAGWWNIGSLTPLDGGFTQVLLPFEPGAVAAGRFQEGTSLPTMLVWNGDGGCLELLRGNGGNLESGGGLSAPLGQATPVRLAPIEQQPASTGDGLVVLDSLARVAVVRRVPGMSALDPASPRFDAFDFSVVKPDGGGPDFMMLAATDSGVQSVVSDAGSYVPTLRHSLVDIRTMAVSANSDFLIAGATDRFELMVVTRSANTVYQRQLRPGGNPRRTVPLASSPALYASVIDPADGGVVFVDIERIGPPAVGPDSTSAVLRPDGGTWKVSVDSDLAAGFFNGDVGGSHVSVFAASNTTLLRVRVYFDGGTPPDVEELQLGGVPVSFAVGRLTGDAIDDLVVSTKGPGRLVFLLSP